MATTVGQHSVATFTSPVNGSTPIDANTVRGNDNTIRSSYNDHDADTGIHVQSSTLASRPAAGTAGRKWVTTDTSNYRLWYDDGTRWHEVGNSKIDVLVKADATLAVGDVVKITGYNAGSSAPTVNKVSSASDTAFGVVIEAIASGSTGYITNTGLVFDLVTNSYSVGDTLYANSSGGFTVTKPTSGTYQASAYVLRSHSSQGVLFVEFSEPHIVERSDNTASTIVLRDGSGAFTTGAITSEGLITFASLKGTGSTTVTNILDEDNMASNSATALATQQSIKAYVDSQVGTVDTLAEILANGNTSGGTNLIMSAGDTLTADTIAETTVGSGVTIDSVLLKDDVVNATDIEVGTISANDGVQSAVIANTTGVMTVASSVLTTTDINGGTVDGAVIGGASPAAGTFTTLTANTNLTIAGTTTVDGVIDDDTMATASATKLATSESIKAYVDTQITAEDLDFAGDSGSGSVDLDSQTFTIAGTSNEIETSASGQTITVGLPTNVTVAGDLTVQDQLLVSGVGPHGLGTTPSSNIQVRQGGSFNASGGTSASAYRMNTVLTGDSSNTTRLSYWEIGSAARMNTPDAGITIADVASVHLSEPAIVKGATDTITNASTLKINSAPTEGTNNYALWVDSGAVRFDGNLDVDGTANLDAVDIDGNVDMAGTLTLASTLTVDKADSTPTLNVVRSDSSIAASNNLMLLQAQGDLGSGAVTGATIQVRADEEWVQGSDSGTRITFTTSTNGTWDSDTERMRIDHNGNVGIGTTDPGALLEVKESSTAAADAVIRLRGNGNNADNTVLGALEWYNADSSGDQPGVVARVEAVSGNPNGHMGELVFKTHDGSEGGEGSNPVERMRIGAAGKVGIGTSSPAKLLEIASTDTNEGIDVSCYSTTQTSAGTIRLKHSLNNTIGSHTAVTVNDHLGRIFFAGSDGTDFYDGAAIIADSAQSYTSTNGGTRLEFWTTPNGTQSRALAMTVDQSGYVGIGTSSPSEKLDVVGNLTVSGSVSKGSGSFKIDHPLPEMSDTHHLVHSFIEGPKADLIYRGSVALVDGAATVDLDAAATMTSGTWEVLCRDPQVWVQNEDGWTQVRGSISGSTLSIEAQDADCTDTVSWLVVAERKDPNIVSADWTDAEGRVIVEPLKNIET